MTVPDSSDRTKAAPQRMTAFQSVLFVVVLVAGALLVG